jgi:murein L,D-transpeptidase YcbB/YkuD
VGTPITFTAVASGFSTTTPAFYAVTDYFGGSSLTTSAINASTGAFSWTPTINDIGTHTLIVRGYNAANDNATTNLVLTVVSSTTPATTTTTSTNTTTANAAKPALTTTQISAILSLLSSFSVSQDTINTVSAILNGQSVPTTGGTTATPTTNGYVFTNFLNKGSTGDEVLELQKRLVVAGFLTVEPTGYFGEATFAAVKAFQAAHGLDQFGYVGPGTRAALNGQ